MTELLDILKSQPILLIFLAVWLLGGLGRLGQKAARKAAEQQQAQRRELRGTGGRGAGSGPAPMVESQTDPRPSPDDIAAEIRRMMGMEEPAAPPRREPEPASRPAPVIRRVEVVDTPEIPRRPSLSEVATRQVASERAASRDRGYSVPEGRIAGASYRRLLDLSDPVAAIVAMEVLGKPRALRRF